MFKDELNQEIGKEINVQRDDTNPNNVFIIEGPHITFSVDPEFESSRENAVRTLEKTENITYKWFKEESGEKHWLLTLYSRVWDCTYHACQWHLMLRNVL